MKKILSFLVFFSALIISCNAFATSYIVPNTKISIYAQSHLESTANLIRLDVPMYNGGSHPWCGDRAYILFEDKELFATALAASISSRAVNVMYEDAAESKNAAGHIAFSCKIISIWW